ncbi:MAG: DUF362 domain-containing protein [bacterium]|nr:DUF362 domain-containing protein [bacterium]
MSDVILIKGTDRQANIQKTLEAIAKKITKDIKALKKNDYILIKPNLVTAKNPSAGTNLASIETLLAFLRKIYKGRIIIGEGTSIGSTSQAFHNYGYDSLKNKYNIELIDLNHDEGIAVEAFDRSLRPIRAYIAKTVVSSPYTISISPIKTHNSVILSLSIENMVTGSLIKGSLKNRVLGYKRIFRRNFQDYKNLINQNYASHNLSIASIIKEIMPNLAIIDGFTSMERNGPVGGQVIETDIALASQDPIALDTLAAYISGFDPGKIGYLHHLQFSKHEINTIGCKISQIQTKLRPPDTFQEQLKWYIPGRK